MPSLIQSVYSLNIHIYPLETLLHLRHWSHFFLASRWAVPLLSTATMIPYSSSARLRVKPLALWKWTRREPKFPLHPLHHWCKLASLLKEYFPSLFIIIICWEFLHILICSIRSDPAAVLRYDNTALALLAFLVACSCSAAYGIIADCDEGIINLLMPPTKMFITCFSWGFFYPHEILSFSLSWLAAPNYFEI